MKKAMAGLAMVVLGVLALSPARAEAASCTVSTQLVKFKVHYSKTSCRSARAIAVRAAAAFPDGLTGKVRSRGWSCKVTGGKPDPGHPGAGLRIGGTYHCKKGKARARFAPWAPSAPSVNKCKPVSFQKNTDNFAGYIRARGVGCPTARALIRALEGGDPSPFGFRCSFRSVTPRGMEYMANYCTNGSAGVKWRRF